MRCLKILVLLGWTFAGALLATGAEAQTTLEKARNDDVALVPDDDPAMAAAFKKARDSLEEFLALAGDPPPGTDYYAVKVGIDEGDQTEFFWITPFAAEGDSFVGQVNNTPRLVSNVREGEVIRFEREEIVDWTYDEGGKTRGNFTACALLTHESPEEAAQFMAEYGLDCSS
jgi:uncharacterized protein YegJ (DUF2314 family)